MYTFERSDTFYLLMFFLVVITAGTVAIKIPGAWAGIVRLNWTDALFTVTSTVCVTGFTVVDTADFSRFGQMILLFLMQIGGLGIISFGSLLLMIPGTGASVHRLGSIKGFYLDGIEYRPSAIIGSILLWTLTIETAGALLLSGLFFFNGIEDWLFMGIFHSISAFCQVGLSPFSGGISGFAANIPVLAVILILAALGGIGFVVLQEVMLLFRKKIRRLSYHSTIVLMMMGIITIVSTLFFFFYERNRLYHTMNTPAAFFNALFQSLNTRSNGFEIIPQQLLSKPSKLLSCMLMFIGGAPGSFGGGIRVTPVFVICVIMIRHPDRFGDISIFRHRLTAQTLNRGIVYVLKALVLCAMCVIALTISEGFYGRSSGAILFEGISAFGNVGLSMGLTKELSTAGKWIIIIAMFAGRVGLFALSFPAPRRKNYAITYPQGSLLLE
ncbi:potassium transporter [Spirochaetia bacterium]|nr:potassium transporter [Spirochaetia bacterium]